MFRVHGSTREKQKKGRFRIVMKKAGARMIRIPAFWCRSQRRSGFQDNLPLKSSYPKLRTTRMDPSSGSKVAMEGNWMPLKVLVLTME